jgi:hypothetical protein
MPEETKNAALSGECKIVPVAQLKKWHRDLDACQKVIWLRGGFDPAYCLDAQDCLKEMEGVLATALPPYGPAPKVHRYRVVKMLSEDGNKIDYKPHGPSVVTADVHDAHVTRLQAENAALQQSLLLMGQKVQQSDQMLNASGVREAALQQRLTIADQRVDDLESDIAAARELLKHGSSPTPAHCESVLDFLAGQSAPAAKGEEPLCLLCLDEKTVPGPKARDFVRDCPDCCGDEG